MATSFTLNFKFPLPSFNQVTYHDDIHNGLKSIDALMATTIALGDYQGVWINSSIYTVGQVLVDGDTGELFHCAIGHTSAASPSTFAQDRTSNSTYWTNVTLQERFKGIWAGGTNYIKGDFVSNGDQYAVCVVDHTSTVFATDVIANYWDVLIDAASTIASATTSAANALTSETNAATSEANAAASALILANVDDYIATDGTTPTTAATVHPTATNSLALGNGASVASAATDAIAIQNATASGVTSVAIGDSAEASTEDSVAIGYAAVASTATGSTALGNNALATGQLATAIGSAAQATNTSSVGIGFVNAATGQYSSALGGRNNTASGTDSTVMGGQTNLASNTLATNLGGQNNSATNLGSTVIGGYTNLASGIYSVTFGGQRAVADKYGQVCHANGRFTSDGDAQGSNFVVRNQTTDATVTELFLNGTTDRLTISSGATWAFKALVAAKQTNGSDESAGYTIEGLIANKAGTTALVGAPTVTVLGEDVAGWTVVSSADNTNDALLIQVTGAVGDNINWVASVQTTEVVG